MSDTEITAGQFPNSNGTKIIRHAPISALDKNERSVLAKMYQERITNFSYAEMYRVFAPPVATLICFCIVDNMIKAGRLSLSDVIAASAEAKKGEDVRVVALSTTERTLLQGLLLRRCPSEVDIDDDLYYRLD